MRRGVIDGEGDVWRCEKSHFAAVSCACVCVYVCVAFRCVA